MIVRTAYGNAVTKCRIVIGFGLIESLIVFLPETAGLFIDLFSDKGDAEEIFAVLDFGKVFVTIARRRLMVTTTGEAYGASFYIRFLLLIHCISGNSATQET